MSFVQDADRLRSALNPLRRTLLDHLRTPASASQLAETLGMSRQKLGYHLNALEAAGLVRMVEERRRRGFVERILVACGDRLVVDPGVLDDRAEATTPSAQDRYAAGHLVAAAAGVVRDVARMQTAADHEGSRLLTFTLETEVAFARPGDLEAFSEAMAEAMAAVAARFHSADPAARRYRVLAAGHPAPKPAPSQTEH